MRALRMLALGAVAMGALASAHAGFKDRILANDSPSVPVGLYLRTDGAVSLGSFVTVRARDVAPAYARARSFTDPGDRLIKRVAAAAGYQVCGERSVVTVGSRRVQRQSQDSTGRLLPTWSGCRVLGEGELFLLGDRPDSFDGRYFGVVRIDQIEGVWRPL